MSLPIRRAASAAVLAVALALTGSACSSDDGGATPSPDETSPTAAAPEPVATEVSFGAVEGRLPAARRDVLAARIGRVVDGWIDAAYLGDYPRTDFAGSWTDFTAGARKEAQRDAALMSNSDIGADVESVEAVRRSVRLDVLSVRKRAVGVTAHVVLRFAATGEADRDVRVAGRLYLTPGDDGWQVFGYDIGKVAL